MIHRTLVPAVLPGLLLVLLLGLLHGRPARGEDDEPTTAELARMVLDGTDAEQALVARWLERADRATLLRLFRALRAARERAAPRSLGFGLPEGAGADGAGTTQVMLEARVIEVPAAAATTLFGAAVPPADLVPTLAYVNAAEVAALLARIESTAGAKILSAPRVMVLDRQQANVTVLNQVSYVQDYDVEVGMGGAQVADPIIGVLQEGLVLDLRPTLSADGRYATIEIEGTWAQVQRPIPEFKTKLADQEVVIQLPELAVRRSKATVRLPDGGSVLIRPERPDSATTEVVTLLHLQVVPPDGAARGIDRGPRDVAPPRAPSGK